MMLDLERVSALIIDVAEEEITPRFRNLQDGDVSEKSAGDPVTVADLETERRLTEGLTALLPGSTVVGEEGVAEDESLLERLDGDVPVWVIDPVDGTRNFTNGSETFCCMVALVQSGEAVAGWIYHPPTRSMALAERGSGVRVDGKAPAPRQTTAHGQMDGAVHLVYSPKLVSQAMEPRLTAFASNRQLYCAGMTYRGLAEGQIDHAFFWGTKPWDHAMGALILAEAGGHTAFLDGQPYGAAIRGRKGLLSVSHAANWDSIRDVLAPGGIAGVSGESPA